MGCSGSDGCSTSCSNSCAAACINTCKGCGGCSGCSAACKNDCTNTCQRTCASDCSGICGKLCTDLAQSSIQKLTLLKKFNANNIAEINNAIIYEGSTRRGKSINVIDIAERKKISTLEINTIINNLKTIDKNIQIQTIQSKQKGLETLGQNIITILKNLNNTMVPTG